MLLFIMAKAPERRLGRLLSHLLESAPCAVSDANKDVAKYYDEEWQEYKEEGVKAALALGNRGPMRFAADGKRHRTSWRPTTGRGSTSSRT